MESEQLNNSRFINRWKRKIFKISIDNIFFKDKLKVQYNLFIILNKNLCYITLISKFKQKANYQKKN